MHPHEHGHEECATQTCQHEKTPLQEIGALWLFRDKGKNREYARAPADVSNGPTKSRKPLPEGGRLEIREEGFIDRGGREIEALGGDERGRGQRNRCTRVGAKRGDGGHKAD